MAHKLTSLTGAFAGLAIVAFGLSWAISEPLPSAGLAAVCAAGIGGLAYLAGLRVVARREVEVLMGAIAARRSAA